SRSAVERIGPITTIQGIVPATGVQHIVAEGTHQGIVAAAPQQRIVPLPTIDGVVACAAIEGVGTAITHKDVVQTIIGAIEVGGPRQGQIPPTISLPARPLCPSRFVSPAAFLCSVWSPTLLARSEASANGVYVGR